MVEAGEALEVAVGHEHDVVEPRPTLFRYKQRFWFYVSGGDAARGVGASSISPVGADIRYIHGLAR